MHNNEMVDQAGSRAASLESLEHDINDILHRAWLALMNDPAACGRYSALFDRTVEGQFYAAPNQVKGEGEQPTWAPNPAYMQSLEFLWEGCEPLLTTNGLGLEKPLREAFYESREYKDFDDVHRRVFVGQLLDTSTGIPSTLYLLSVPHSHAGFDLSEAPTIVISRTLRAQSSARTAGVDVNAK